MATDQKRLDDAAAKYGRSIDHIAARYVNPKTGEKLSGEALLRKLVKGESGGRKAAVSSAGARSYTQFMPGTRAALIKKYGIDPWRSPEEAVHGAALHMRGKLGNALGLEGYNPGGGQDYVNYIVGQEVGEGSGNAAASRMVKAAVGGTSASSAPSDGGGLAAQLRALAGQLVEEGPAPLPQAGIQAPDFTAQAVMPEGYQPVQGGGLQQAPSENPMKAQLEQIAAQAEQQVSLPEPGVDDAAAPSGGGGAGSAAAPASGGSRSSTELRPGGGYKGTEGVAKGLFAIGQGLGLQSTSEKRHNTNPYSGKGSDHDVGNADAYAVDMSNGSAPTPAMDRTAYRVMRELGDTKYRMGQAINTSRGVFTKKTKHGTYRIQVIYRGAGAAFGGNHLNHVHVGVKRVG